MEKSSHNQKMLPPPPLRKSLVPGSPIKPLPSRKSSISRQLVPLEFSSASPTIRNNLCNYSHMPSGASPSLSGRRTPSLAGRPAARRETEDRLMKDIFDDLGLINDQENSKGKGSRKRPLFGHPERKNKRRAEEVVGEQGEKESSHQPKELQDDGPPVRRFLVRSPHLSSPRSPKKRGDLSSYVKEWPMAERVYGEASKRVKSKRASSPFGHAEDQHSLENWFEGQRVGSTSNHQHESYSEENPSSPYYEHIQDTERTILGPSSSPPPEQEKKKERVPGLKELDESLKLIPDPINEYRPGSYSSLSDEQWLSAGQKLIERFCESSQKIQSIITTRAERMAGYTTMISEYHNLLRLRRAKLKEERESIQKGVRGSIAGYWKSQDM